MFSDLSIPYIQLHCKKIKRPAKLFQLLRQKIILLSKLKICTKLFDKNEENHYKMKQYTKNKELYYE